MSETSFIRVKFEKGKAVGDLELHNVDWGQMLIASDVIANLTPSLDAVLIEGDISIYFTEPGSVKYNVDQIGVSKEQMLVASTYLKLEGERYCILAVNTAEATVMREMQMAEQRRLELPV